MDNFHDEANPSRDISQDFEDSDFDSELISGRKQSELNSARRRFIPIEFAKQHILKIEEDMKKMHERHVKLMREMDENYRMIEQETQEYYIEFLQKWKELAKAKIARYRQQCDELVAEKVQIVKNKDQQLETFNDRITTLLKEKERLMRDYANDIRLRESEMESMRIAFNEDLAKKEREKTQLKHRLEEANQRVSSLERDLGDYRQQEEQRDAEVNRLRDDFEQRINEYEDTLNAKIRENQELSTNLRDT